MISGVLLDQRTGRPIVDRELRARLEARGWEQVVENLERSRRPLFGLERNPPLFMDVSSAYSGDELGLPYRDIMGEGIVLAADLAVTGQAGANSVNIAKGSCWVVGDTNVDLQPTYRMFNDAVVNLGISPDPALARRVHVIAQVTDQGFAGTGRLWALQALHGTPNAAPVLPALPASAISLANILVPAAAATSAAYTITDTRGRTRVGGGQAPSSGAVMPIFDQTLAAQAATVTVPLTTDYDHLTIYIRARSLTGAAGNDALRMRFNGNSDANYYYGFLQGFNTAAPTHVHAGADSKAFGGHVATTTQNGFSDHVIKILNYRAARFRRWQFTNVFQAEAAGADQNYVTFGGGVYRFAGSDAADWLTSLVFSANAADLAIGTRITAYGEKAA